MREGWILFLLAIVQFTHIVDFMIIMPLGAQLMEILSITPRQFSWIVSVYAFSAFGSGLISAYFLNRFDRKVALLTLYIGFTLGTLACGFAPNYIFLLLARAVTGAFGGLLGALVISIVADMVPLERRSSAMGLIMTAFSAASILGVPAGIYFAASFSWHAPFIILAVLSVITWLVIWAVFPNFTKHIQDKREQQSNVFRLIFKDKNQQRALFFTIILMLGHFSVIPFIAPYMQMNIGFSDYEISYIYLFGGIMTVIMLPLVGRLSDKYGNAFVFTVASCFAICSLFMLTNLPKVSIPVALAVTCSFFIVASGRSVPAMTLVTAVVKPEHRGGFMSVRASVAELGLALSSGIAGLIIIEQPDGTLGHYNWVGYLAIGMSILAVWFAKKLKVAE